METRPRVKHSIPDTIQTQNYTTKGMTGELKWKRAELALLLFKFCHMADLGTGPRPPQMRPSRRKMGREMGSPHRTRRQGTSRGCGRSWGATSAHGSSFSKAVSRDCNGSILARTMTCCPKPGWAPCYWENSTVFYIIPKILHLWVPLRIFYIKSQRPPSMCPPGPEHWEE